MTYGTRHGTWNFLDRIGGLAEHHMELTFPDIGGRAESCWDLGTGYSDMQHGAMLVGYGDAN